MLYLSVTFQFKISNEMVYLTYSYVVNEYQSNLTGAKSGWISFRNFYLRRIKRIVPMALTVIIAALIIVQIYVLQFRWWWSAFYCIVAIIIPLMFIFIKLFKAFTADDFHRLSTIIKIVMLTGILSMVFFKFYF